MFSPHERANGPEEDAASRPIASPPSLPPSFSPAEWFYTFFLYPSESEGARRGVAKSSVGRRLKSGGGF